MIKYILVFITFITVLSGCKKDEYNVPDEFNVYIQRFENEGRLRGRSFDLQKQGLIIEFADFTGQDQVALTNYEDPIRIQVDKTYWDENSDIFREFVMFHEFGHAFLEIHNHRNDTLPNGDWASIMRGPPANSQTHNIDYGKHRDYYVDELFLDKVRHPDWSYRSAIIELVSKDTAFGLLLVNSSKSKIVTIKNKTDKQVYINSIHASDCFSSDFTGSIPPNDSVNVSFTFRPAEQKTYSGVVLVNHSIENDTEIKPLSFELSGEGSASFAVGEWIEKVPFPGVARYEAASFSISGSGFVCLGRTYASGYTNEIWEYNTAGQWIGKSSFPGISRSYPIGFSIKGKGYLGLGYEGNELWEYNYPTDSWTKKSDFPGQPRINAVCFSTSTKGYVGLGYDGTSLFKDFWEYDPVSGKWTRLPDYPGKANTLAAGFTVNDRIFVGTGCDGESSYGHANSDFWEYNASAKQWTRKADFAGGKTNSAISFSVNNYGYLGGGTNESGNGIDHSFWEYDPAKDKWSKKAYLPDFSDGGIFYSSGNKGYFGLGYMTSPYFWEFDPDH